MTALKVGDLMPEFSALDMSGDTVTSAQLLKQGPLVLYFYPKDETTVCTAQACGFRDAHEEFMAAGAQVVGVSPDTPESHRKFANHHNLPFGLLADPQRLLFKLFGVSDTLGIMPGRETFVFDHGGRLKHHYRSQLFGGKHVAQALETVRAISASSGGGVRQ